MTEALPYVLYYKGLLRVPISLFHGVSAGCQSPSSIAQLQCTDLLRWWVPISLVHGTVAVYLLEVHMSHLLQVYARKCPCRVGNPVSIELAQLPFGCYSTVGVWLLILVVRCRANVQAMMATSSIELAQPPFGCYSKGCEWLLILVVLCRAVVHSVLITACPFELAQPPFGRYSQGYE